MANLKSKKSIVYENLKRKIISNSLKSGEPLNEGDLSRELKTSKTPVREALQQLERDGLVENIPGKGCFVSKISFQDIKELFEIREILECEVIKRGALKGDREKIEKVRREFESLESNGTKSPKTQFKAGDRIHFYLFETLGNSRLNEIYRRLQDHVDRMRIHFFNEAREERSEQSYREHIEILDALVARDPERAEKAVRNHLRNSLEFLKKVI
jgi:GntR family transcriptional regulator, rspAB operon transcriptional repressor